MSKWYEITDKEDIELSEDHTEIDVLFDCDRFGSKYVTIPTGFLHELLGPCKPAADSVVLKSNEAGERMKRALEIRKELFTIANSFGGNETGTIAIYLHEACNYILRANELLES